MADEIKLQVKTITIPASPTGSDTETLYIKDEQAREDIQAILDSKTATYKTEAKTDIITVDAVDELNTDIDNAKVDKVNPTATGALSLNAAEGETAGTNSVSINGLATGDYALAEGRMSGASGIASHAEGYYTAAMGDYSHTEGKGTAATRRSQHVFGEYNAVDTSIGSSGADRGRYVEVVGNGADSSHGSNARTLDWSGNENLAGNLTVEGKKINNINVPDVSLTNEVFALQSEVVLKADKAKINTLDGNNILATGDKTDIKVKTVANQKLIGAEGNINVLTVADYDASSATAGAAVAITKDTYDALVAVDAIRLQIAAGKIILNKVAKEGTNVKFSSSIGGTNLNEDNYYIILSDDSGYTLTYYYEQTPYVKATSVAQTIYGQKTFNAGLATKGISATGDITATGKITAQSGAEITNNPLIINNVRISDGNNNTYGFILPDSTNYTENKILATEGYSDNNLNLAKAYTDTQIENLPEPMIFKGTLGTGGTITSLPTAAASNEGHTYKVITAGSYASKEAKVGDTFISTGSAWELVPSGDDVEDTYRKIKVNGTELLGNEISTGDINFKNGGHITVSGSGNDITLGIEANYSIPSDADQLTWSNKQPALSSGSNIQTINNHNIITSGNYNVDGITYETSLPGSANTSGLLKVVLVDTEPTADERKNGWLYLVYDPNDMD